MQSATGNITGIFDVVGGSHDFIIRVLTDSNGDPQSGDTTSSNSGFNGSLSIGSMESGIPFPPIKYYDLYTSTSTSNACNGPCFGHALYETDYWYSDANQFFDINNPWLHRGGLYNNGKYGGGLIEINLRELYLM